MNSEEAGIPLAYASRPPDPLPPMPNSTASSSLFGGSSVGVSRGDRFFILGGAPPVRTNRRAEPFRGQGGDRWRPQNFRDHQASVVQQQQPLPVSFHETDSRCFCCNTFMRHPRQAPAFTCAVCRTVCDLVPPQRQQEQRRVAPLDPRNISQLSSTDDLRNMLDMVFDDVESLNESFRTYNGDLNRPALEAFNSLFKADEPARIDQLLSATKRFLRRPGIAIVDSDALWSLVLLESPLLSASVVPSAAERTWIMSRLIGLISNLTSAQQSLIMDHVSSESTPVETVRERVDNVISHLSLRIRESLELPEPGAYLNDWGVQTSCRTAAVFFLANRAKERIPITSFYSTIIDGLGTQLLQQAFEGVKIWLLSFDGERQMREKIREAIRSTLLYHQLVQPFLNLFVRREHIVQDSLEQISSKREELKKKLRIIFEGEEGVDAGGLTKEWFLVLCRQLFDPQYGMFVYEQDTHLAYFNPASLESEDEFFLVGATVGLAIYNSVNLDIPLPLAVYKKMMNEPCGLHDLRQMRPDLANGLEQLLTFEGDVEGTFLRSFTVETEVWGEIQEVELVERGRDIAVTSENRKEYVEAYVDFLLNKNVSQQFEAFAAGFKSVTSGNALPLFVGAELELLVRGSPEPLDLDQLKSVTTYEGFEGEWDPTIKLFWEAFGGFDSEQQRNLLRFVTGSDRIPATGTSALALKISLLPGEDTTRLPQAHTCFNQLCLYRYPDVATMRAKLLLAMTET